MSRAVLVSITCLAFPGCVDERPAPDPEVEPAPDAGRARPPVDATPARVVDAPLADAAPPADAALAAADAGWPAPGCEPLDLVLLHVRLWGGSPRCDQTDDGPWEGSLHFTTEPEWLRYTAECLTPHRGEPESLPVIDWDTQEVVGLLRACEAIAVVGLRRR